MENNGLDISKFNSGISFEDIKNKGYEFLIIRCGYTGSKNKSFAKDGYFESFYKQAKANGIPCGCYFFSRATTQEEGVKEASWVYENCLKGKQFEFPIYIDVEDEVYQKKATKENLSKAIIGFCNYLEKMGYYVGYYINPSWMENHVEYNMINQYDLWLAHWVKKPTQKWKYGMWQCSGSKNGAVIEGSNQKCDRNVCYKDYPSIIKKYGLNGYTLQEEETKQEEKPIEATFNVGDKVEIIGYGNSKADGSGIKRDSIGNVFTILSIDLSKLYPYAVGTKIGFAKITSGYYQADGLKKKEE